jgi:UrcA family protein
MKSRIFWPALAAALCIQATATTAHAEQLDDHSIKVEFADLDLQTSSGKEALRGRIRSAAMKVCSHRADPSFQLAGEYRSCVEHATDNALAHVTRSMR